MLSHFSHVTLWTVAHQGPLTLGFSRQEYWGGMPCLPPGDLLDPGIESTSLRSAVLAGGFFTTRATWEASYILVDTHICINIKWESFYKMLCICMLSDQEGVLEEKASDPLGQVKVDGSMSPCYALAAVWEGRMI